MVSSTLSRPAPRYVGRISYAWYLWHWPVLVLATATWGEATIGEDGASHTDASWIVVVLAVALSFGLAAVSHHLVEQPMRQLRLLTVSRRRSLIAGGVLVATSLAASLALVVSVPAPGDDLSVAAPVSGPAGADGTTGVDRALLREPNTPAEARDSTPSDLSPCYLGYAPTDVAPAEDCRTGPATGGTRTIALIGDSHATAWLPAFRKAAQERGWTLYFYAKSACSVVDVAVQRAGTSATYDACTTWRNNLLDRLDEVDGLDAVVVGRWMAYRNSTLQPNGSTSTPSNVGPVWREGAERTFDRLRRVTPNIVVLDDVPWPNGDVPACLSKHPQDVEACSFSRDQASGLDAVLAKEEEAAAPKAVKHLDMTDVICPEERCQVVSATGQIIFRDEHHLTAGFSAAMWETLSERLQKAMG